MAQTELASQRNRVGFAVGDETECGDSAMGLDMGMVGRKDSNKLEPVMKNPHCSCRRRPRRP